MSDRDTSTLYSERGYYSPGSRSTSTRRFVPANGWPPAAGARARDHAAGGAEATPIVSLSPAGERTAP